MFFNQSWFWAILIPAIVTLGSLWLTKKYQIKLERIKLYETDQFKAYDELYKFISSGYSIWPPNDERLDYIGLMKGYYLKTIKQNMLFYQPEIRELLKQMEAQYYSLTDPDIYTDKPFVLFFREDFLDTLIKIEKLIEKKIDELVHKPKSKWLSLLKKCGWGKI